MNFEEFKSLTDKEFKKINISIDDNKCKKMFDFMNTLLEWNKSINLTAITNPKEVIIKHFVDSLIISNKIKENSKVIDMGTGAGFPGIPLAIVREDINITLGDSLNKRINFLNEIINEENLNNSQAVHGRAEELGRNKDYREKYDVAVSRAVAKMNVLVEYLLPFVKVGGICICMKGPNYKEEVNESKKAIEKLGGRIEELITLKINEKMERNIIIIRKIKQTSSEYPRKPGVPNREPIK